MHSLADTWCLTYTPDDLPLCWYLVYLFVLFALDIRYGIAARVTREFSAKVSSEDAVFVIAFVSSVLFFIVNGDGISLFLGIVDSADVRCDMLRLKVVRAFLVVVIGGAPIVGLACGIVARRRGMGPLKWFFYGAWFNVLALARLLTLPPPEHGM